VQITPINSVGIASISLRGFGANRSLVLVDGRRATPTNALMVVDVNSIPSSMIRSAEIISGGASATYGADAMGGVSNFQLKRKFEGLEADYQYGITDVSDNQEMRASVIAGTKFADGRGNMVFAAEYYNRKAAYDKNRSFYTDAYADPTVGGNFIGFIMGANGWNAFTNGPDGRTLAAMYGPNATATPGPNAVCSFGSLGTNNTCSNQAIRFNADGSLYLNSVNTRGLSTFTTHPVDNFRYGVVKAYSNAECSTGSTGVGGVLNCAAGPKLINALKYNETEGFTSSPQTRYAFMASTDYDITDKLHFQSSARFATSNTETFLAGTNASFGWEVQVPYNATTDSPILPALSAQVQNNPALAAAILANPTNPLYANPNFIPHGTLNAAGQAIAGHPVPVSMALLLNSRATNPTTASWIMETWPLDSFGRRATHDTNEAWQIETGLTYDLPIKDWTAEVYYSRGESSTYNVAFGNNSLARWRGEVGLPDYGYHSKAQSNGNFNPGASVNFGSVAVPCTSGFYDQIFKGDAVATADCNYAVQAPLQTRTQNQQDIFELNLQGGLFNLPAGELRAAAGYQQRRNASQFNPDILQSTASFTDQVIGVYPTGYLNKQTVAKDIWAEVLVPVVSDLGFLKKIELELGGRHSDYSSTDSTDTYKINGNIQFTDWLRFRGGYNKATRAPNLGELYLPIQQIFGGSGVYGDPCALLSNSPFGAGGAIIDGKTAPYNPFNNGVGGQTPTLAAGQTQAGAQSAYLICKAMMGGTGSAGVNQFYGSTNTQAAAAGSAWNNYIGNPNLDSEKATTYTAGIVLRSPFEHPLLRRMQATVDWYKIDINDAILPYTADYANYLCYGAVRVTTAAEATAQANSQFCLNVPRSQTTGGGVSSLNSYANQAWVKTRGVDFTFNWSADLADLGLASIPGSLNLGVNGTWLDSYKTRQSPSTFDVPIEWKGSLGPQLSSFNAGAYDYRLFTNLGYTLASFGVNLRWRHLPEVEPAGKASTRAIIANNLRVAGGAAGQLLSYTPSVAQNIKQYDQFDLSAFWNLTDAISLRFGVDNVFNTQPPSVARTLGRPYDYGQTPAQNAARLAATCSGAPAPGCLNPTTYSLPSSGLGSSNGGFYDVLGRRYFVGIKAKF